MLKIKIHYIITYGARPVPYVSAKMHDGREDDRAKTWTTKNNGKLLSSCIALKSAS